MMIGNIVIVIGFICILLSPISILIGTYTHRDLSKWVEALYISGVLLLIGGIPFLVLLEIRS